jgi:hypothetical protein
MVTCAPSGLAGVHAVVAAESADQPQAVSRLDRPQAGSRLRDGEGDVGDPAGGMPAAMARAYTVSRRAPRVLRFNSRSRAGSCLRLGRWVRTFGTGLRSRHLAVGGYLPRSGGGAGLVFCGLSPFLFP